MAVSLHRGVDLSYAKRRATEEAEPPENGRKLIRLGVDLDDTLAHIKELARRRVNAEFGTNLSFRDIKDPLLERNLDGVVVTEADMKRIFREIWSDLDKIFLLDPKIPEIMTRLHGSGIFQLTISTATDASDSTIVGFLRKHGIPFDDIVHVRSSRQKLDAEIDVYVDDYHVIAEGAVQRGRMAILVKQPWNRAYRSRGREHHHEALVPARMEHLEDRLREMLRF